MQCPVCRGTRYRDDILKVRYRDRSIADVLDMSVREAYAFFRGYEKVQQRLKRMIDVGLEYIKLGQPATTLSSGEGQRLKLAAFLASASRRRTLFILDEPTTGLHFADIVRLVDCFDALLADGHGLVVIEHNSMLMGAADYLIDLGPGAAEEGRQVVEVIFYYQRQFNPLDGVQVEILLRNFPSQMWLCQSVGQEKRLFLRLL